MDFNLHEHKYKKIHFIGIGGISMSGMAEILLHEGYKISGSDSGNSRILNRLILLGADVKFSHDPKNVIDSDLVIYTDAISKDNLELNKAIDLGIPTIDRATFLGKLMKNYKHSVAVSGTHGKTTTTSMIATITNRSKLNPTILLGGELDEIGGNVRLGSDDYILTEACEYKANILKYEPTMAIILNIDEDHLDFFRSIDHIIETFLEYASKLKETDVIILNNDDVNMDHIKKNTKAKIITFGINNESDFMAKNIIYDDNGTPSFELVYKDLIIPIKLSVIGIHNIYNALAAITSTYLLGVDINTIKKYITLYTGVHRRLETKGFFNEVKVYDDYAHHPTEIMATLKSLKNISKNKIYCIFQPHTYTRTKILLESFSEAFMFSDLTIVTDIYAAREKDLGEIHSIDLVNALNKKGSPAIYLKTFYEIKNYLLKNCVPGDFVVTMGAGNIYILGEEIIKDAKTVKIYKKSTELNDDHVRIYKKNN